MIRIISDTKHPIKIWATDLEAEAEIQCRNMAALPFIHKHIAVMPDAQTAGVECRKDADVIDEIPGAYKPIDEVMANQADLVEIVHTLKQLICIKG